MKILDTDHCIAVIRGQLQLTHHLQSGVELAVTVISIGELVHGAEKSDRPVHHRVMVDAVLASLKVLPFELEAARHFGELKAVLERSGMRLADIDLQIASIALQHQSPLVTHTRRHFQRIPRLILEDWIA